MPRIARGQENTINNINWFTSVSGTLTDVSLMEFCIRRIEAGLPGTQVFPLVGYENVSAAPGHFVAGGYYAYDNTAAKGWTPALDAALGTHRIEWRWKLLPTSSYQNDFEDFEVTAASVVTLADYLELQDLYDNAGVARTHQYFDDNVDGTLTDESAYVQRILSAAEHEAYSRMLRGWSRAEIIALAGVDLAFRAHVAWIALELASERRTEFAADDGKGAYWAQYERAIDYCEALSKGRRRSTGESVAGQPGTLGGNLRPTTAAKEATSFVFAPSEEAPDGHGGYLLPFALFVAHAVYQAVMMTA